MARRGPPTARPPRPGSARWTWSLRPRARWCGWRTARVLAADLGNCMYTSPVVENAIAFFIDGTMSAVQLPGQAAEQIECKELWSGELAGEFFASPLVHGGRVYTVDKSANYHVIDAGTGKVILKRKLEMGQVAGADNASIYPSLCLGGKNLWVGNDAGETMILEPGDGGCGRWVRFARGWVGRDPGLQRPARVGSRRNVPLLPGCPVRSARTRPPRPAPACGVGGGISPRANGRRGPGSGARRGSGWSGDGNGRSGRTIEADRFGRRAR